MIRSPELAAKYTANWQAHSHHSEPYEGKRERLFGEGEGNHTSPRCCQRCFGWLRGLQELAVFHRADCKSAAKISAKNLVRYATRDEAIPAGKKPCHECNP